MAPGNQATLDMLQDVRRRPQQPREPLTPEMLTFQPDMEFQLDEKKVWERISGRRREVLQEDHQE